MVTKAEASCKMTPSDFEKLLKYDPETGLFYWLVDIRCGANKRIFRKAGDVAGSKCENGYLVVTVNYQRFYGHRLAWFLTKGHWPVDRLDHINLDRSDTRISNLRPATDLQNRSNTAARAKSGFKGVLVPKHAPNSYVTQITVDNKNRYLGCFSTPEAAHAAYCRAATQAFGEFARFN